MESRLLSYITSGTICNSRSHMHLHNDNLPGGSTATTQILRRGKGRRCVRFTRISGALCNLTKLTMQVVLEDVALLSLRDSNVSTLVSGASYLDSRCPLQELPSRAYRIRLSAPVRLAMRACAVTVILAGANLDHSTPKQLLVSDPTLVFKFDYQNSLFNSLS